ncbi:MAG: leucine-rich repeat domain-containing protein [Desulfosporosinus sp.]
MRILINNKSRVFFIGFIMMFFLFCNSNQVQAVGQEGDYTFIIIDNGTYNSIEITEYTGGGGNVSIPGILFKLLVTSIGDSAFFFKTITSVSLPGTITNIGNDAFSLCRQLTSITLPEGLTHIGNYAFDQCIGLTGINIPKSTMSIGNSAFMGCKLTSITLRSPTTIIYDSANTIPVTTTIIGYDPSTAKDYATKYSRTFEAISNNSAITSSIYTISGTEITNIPFGTSKETFLANLSKGEDHQTWNTVSLNDPVFSNNKIIVTAQDGTTTKYTTKVDTISETLVLSDQSTTGFNVSISPVLAGLTKGNFVLRDDEGNVVKINSAATIDNGANYTISALLIAGKTYTVTAMKTDCDFGSPIYLIVQLLANPVIQIGGNPNDSNSLGIFIGLDNIKDSSGNVIANQNIAEYQIEVDYDPAKVTIPDAINETGSGQFAKTIDPTGKLVITYASTTGVTGFAKLCFLPIILTGSALDLTSIQVKYLSVIDTNQNQISVVSIPDLVFQRGKILNEGPGALPNINDAVAGLQYLAGLKEIGSESGQINVINMASILQPEEGATGIKPSVKDVIALIQKLVGLRDDSFQLIQ